MLCITKLNFPSHLQISLLIHIKITLFIRLHELTYNRNSFYTWKHIENLNKRYILRYSSSYDCNITSTVNLLMESLQKVWLLWKNIVMIEGKVFCC